MKNSFFKWSKCGVTKSKSVHHFLFLPLILFLIFFRPAISESAIWTPLNTSQYKFVMFGVDFINANTGFAVGGRLIGHILKTTDGGQTWENQPFPLYDFLVGSQLRSVKFVDENTGYVVGVNGLIFKTTNSGTDWVRLDSTFISYTDVDFLNANTGFIVASSTSGGIHRTSDGGENWQSTTFSIPLNGVSIGDANNITVVGDAGYIYKSTNAGANWFQQTSDVITTLWSVSFINANTGMAAGFGGRILKTTNGGTNWVSLSTGTTSELLDINFINENNATAVGAGGIILRTVDGGDTWLEQTSNTVHNLWSVSFVNNNIGFASGGFTNIGGDSGSVILKTTNGGLPVIDAGISSIVSPGHGQIINAYGTNVSAYLTNYGDTTISNVNVYAVLNDGTPVGPVVVPGPLEPEDSILVEFTGANQITSVDELDFAVVRVYVQYPGDLLYENDTNSVMVFVRIPISTYPYLSDFSEMFLPYSNPNNFFMWQLFHMETDPSGELSEMGMANFFSVFSGYEEVLRTTLLDLTQITNPVLSFYRAYTTSLIVPQNDQLEIVVSTDGGMTWSAPLFSRGWTSEPSLGTVPPMDGPYFPSNANDWMHNMVWLQPYIGQQIVIGFNAISSGGNNLWIDNIKIFSPVDISFFNITGPGIYGSLDTFGVEITFNSLRPSIGEGSPDGVLTITRVDDFPLNNTFAINDTARTSNDSIFTPDVVADRYWEIAYSGDDWNSVANYDITLDISGQLGIVDPSLLYIIKRVDQNSPWVCHSTITGFEMGVPVTLSASGLQGFSQFGIGASDGTLPVDLIEFNATVWENNVSLNWKTSWEENNLRFDIQRSEVNEVGTSNWITVGSVKGSGTVYEETSYSFLDKKLITGKYQYRLMQVDINGNSTADHQLATIVEIGMPERFELSQNYPNPFNPVTKINFQLPVDDFVTLNIYDVTGRVVATLVNDHIKAGYHTVEFNGSNIASGVYFYRISTERASQVKKMLMIK